MGKVKNKSRAPRSGAIYKDPGIYEVDKLKTNEWVKLLAGTRVIVEHQTDFFENKKKFEYFTIRRLGKKTILFKSYEVEEWNSIVYHLREPLDESMDSFVERLLVGDEITEFHLSGILENLENSTGITREQIGNAVDDFYATYNRE